MLLLRRLAATTVCCLTRPEDDHRPVGTYSRGWTAWKPASYSPSGSPRGPHESLTDDCTTTTSDVISACWDPAAAAAANDASTQGSRPSTASSAPPPPAVAAAAALQAPRQPSRQVSAAGRGAPSEITPPTPRATSKSAHTLPAAGRGAAVAAYEQIPAQPNAGASAAGYEHEQAHPDTPCCSYPLPEQLRGLAPAARQAGAIALAEREHELNVRLNGSLNTAKELFWGYHAGGDGRLKPEEFLGLVAGLELDFNEEHVREFARRCFEAADTTRCGSLGLWDWMHLYQLLSAVRRAFSRSDAYSTAQLSERDFARLMVELGESAGVLVPEDPLHQRAIARRAFSNIDMEGRGYVTFEGVLAWFVTEPLRGCLQRRRDGWRSSSSGGSSGGGATSSGGASTW